jgi:phosphoribosylanthranilate isomerase
MGSMKEAALAVRYGADAIGLVGKMPSGPGPIPDELILEISKSIPPSVSRFLLTSETSPEGIINHHRRTLTDTIQIVDEPEPGSYKLIKHQIPYIRIVQVIHVIDEKSVDKAVSLSYLVDGLLLDSGNPDLKIKELGGTGRVHNWNLSRRIVDSVKIPVFLAGGLTSENVAEAIQTVQPFGVDVCSGVRTEGYLDERKLMDFISKVSKL